MPARTAWVFISLLLFTAAVEADTILQVSGPNNFFAEAENEPGSASLGVVSWNQAIGYDGVSISFQGTGISSPAAGTAYLMTSMGPGTTIADQIATTPFSELPGQSSTISLFSGLDLPAGPYYLMIFADLGSQLEWDAADYPDAATTLGQGVSLTFPAADGEILGGLTPYAPYPPATDFLVGFQDDLLVDVTSTPEPGTLSMLVVCGLVGLIVRRLGRHFPAEFSQNKLPSRMYRPTIYTDRCPSGS